MKQRSIWLSLLVLLAFAVQQAAAKLVLEGLLAMELAFEKSENTGSIIANPNVHFPNSTKLGLVIKSDDSSGQIRAYFPVLLNLSTLQIGSSLGQYITGGEVTPDNWRQFFGSEYYFVAKGKPFTAGVSNRRVGDEPDYSFIGFDDGLGAFAALNSDQPLLTTKLHGSWGETKITAYKIWDQPVAYLPVNELLPPEVADYQLESGKPIGSYPYRGEMADYSLLQLQRSIGGWRTSVHYGKKLVDNPQFYETAQSANFAALNGLRLERENIGFELNRTFPAGFEISASFLKSRSVWSRYAGVGNVNGQNVPQWDLLGGTAGAAGQIAILGLQLGPAFLNVRQRAVDPGFYPVAARDENYSYGWFNLLPADPQTTLLYRALPDPSGRYSDGEIASPLVTYLGMRSLEADLVIPGQFAGLYGSLQLKGQEHKSIAAPREMDFDPVTGDRRIKDFREIGATLTLMAEQGDIFATRLSNRSYLADWDYLREIQFQWLRSWRESLTSEVRLERYGRLRSFQDYLAEPESRPLYRDSGYLNRFAWSVRGTAKGGIVFRGEIDLRQGTYEKDLLFETSDRVFGNPYKISLLRLYADKTHSWPTASGQVRVELAAELTTLSGQAGGTPLAECLGNSIVGMVKAGYPWTKAVRHEMTLLGVAGSLQSHFPSNYLASTWHNELVISPWGDSESNLKIGFTIRPLGEEQRKNLYAVFTGGLGFGSWSLTLGKGTLREFTEPPYRIPGQYYEPQPLVDPEIAGRPWEIWRNLNAARGNDTTAQNWVMVRYWYRF